MSGLEKEAIAQQQLQQVADKKARQQQLLRDDWLYARAQVDIARSMASQANQVCSQTKKRDKGNAMPVCVLYRKAWCGTGPVAPSHKHLL